MCLLLSRSQAEHMEVAHNDTRVTPCPTDPLILEVSGLLVSSTVEINCTASPTLPGL